MARWIGWMPKAALIGCTSGTAMMIAEKPSRQPTARRKRLSATRKRSLDSTCVLTQSAADALKWRPKATMKGMRAVRESDNPEYLRMREETLIAGLRKA